MKDNLVEWTENIFKKKKKKKWEQHYFGYHHLTYLNLLTFICFCFSNALLIVYYYYIISIWRNNMRIAWMYSRVVVSRPHHHHHNHLSLPPSLPPIANWSHTQPRQARPEIWRRFSLHSCSGNVCARWCDAGMGCCQRREQLEDYQWGD